MGAVAATPVRMCRVCRRRQSKAVLTRLVWQGGQWQEDANQTMPGRGFYVCSPECRAKLKVKV